MKQCFQQKRHTSQVYLVSQQIRKNLSNRNIRWATNGFCSYCLLLQCIGFHWFCNSPGVKWSNSMGSENLTCELKLSFSSLKNWPWSDPTGWTSSFGACCFRFLSLEITKFYYKRFNHQQNDTPLSHAGIFPHTHQ